MGLGFECDSIRFLCRPFPTSFSSSSFLPSFPISFHQTMLRMKKDGNLEERADSECCSGCQSGWTLYLDHSQSQDSTNSFQLRAEDSTYCEEEDDYKEEEEEEEDLSMLSDASSGPPHVHEEEENISSCCCDDGDDCLCNATFLPLTTVAKNGIKRRRAEKEEQQEKQDSFLDDTASSTLFTFSKATTTSSCSSKKLSMEDDHSCCFSATHFKGKTALRKHLGYLHSSAGMQTRR